MRALDPWKPCASLKIDAWVCTIHAVQQAQNRGISDMRVRDLRWVRWDMPGDFTEYYDVYSEAERYTGYDGTRGWGMKFRS